MCCDVLCCAVMCCAMLRYGLRCGAAVYSAVLIVILGMILMYGDVMEMEMWSDVTSGTMLMCDVLLVCAACVCVGAAWCCCRTEMAEEQADALCTHHVVNEELSRATADFAAIVRQALASDGEDGSGE